MIGFMKEKVGSKDDLPSTEGESSLSENISAETREADISAESLSKAIQEIDTFVKKQSSSFAETEETLKRLRLEIGIPEPKEQAPSLQRLQEEMAQSELRRVQLEARLEEVLRTNRESEYAELIEKVRLSKIDWANSEELARRLKLKGVTDDDMEQIRTWLTNNASGAKTYILTAKQFQEAVQLLSELSGEQSLGEASGFYIGGGRTDVPESARNSVLIKEEAKPPLPPVPGRPHPEQQEKASIDENLLHHELGHATQDGLLESDVYADWTNRTKEGAPDPEYIGSIRETDVRLRSMFRELAGSFDPKKGPFTSDHLALIKKMKDEYKLGKDTVDLLNNYEDETIIELANHLPAI